MGILKNIAGAAIIGVALLISLLIIGRIFLGALWLWHTSDNFWANVIVIFCLPIVWFALSRGWFKYLPGRPLVFWIKQGVETCQKFFFPTRIIPELLCDLKLWQKLGVAFVLGTILFIGHILFFFVMSLPDTLSVRNPKIQSALLEYSQKFPSSPENDPLAKFKELTPRPVDATQYVKQVLPNSESAKDNTENTYSVDVSAKVSANELVPIEKTVKVNRSKAGKSRLSLIKQTEINLFYTSVVVDVEMKITFSDVEGCLEIECQFVSDRLTVVEELEERQLNGWANFGADTLEAIAKATIEQASVGPVQLPSLMEEALISSLKHHHPTCVVTGVEPLPDTRQVSYITEETKASIILAKKKKLWEGHISPITLRTNPK